MKDPKAFIEYSIQIIRKMSVQILKSTTHAENVMSDDMIADMISNKGLSPIVTELLIRGRKLNVSSVFITQSYLQVPKDLTLIFTHFFIVKIQNKQELQQIAFSHLVDIGFEDFMNLYKKCTAKPYSF